MTGKIVWEAKNKAPLWGGVLTTAGGLVFYGTPEGFLKALDAKTGDEVWKFQVGTGVVSSPITWNQDGEQWIGVAAGWGGAVPAVGWRGRQVDRRHQPGRLVLGLPPAEEPRGALSVRRLDAKTKAAPPGAAFFHAGDVPITAASSCSRARSAPARSRARA